MVLLAIVGVGASLAGPLVIWAMVSFVQRNISRKKKTKRERESTENREEETARLIREDKEGRGEEGEGEGEGEEGREEGREEEGRDRAQEETQPELIKDENEEATPIPLSVNYHFTRQCNYKCGFCFHTATTSFVLPIEEAKKGLKMLRDAGMQKLNFSGGEPFIHQRGRYVGELTKYCKEELKLPSVSIISNGSLATEKWFREYGQYLDIMGVSCDSFDPQVNALIGRQQGTKDHLKALMKVRGWCSKYKVAFKLNTVVNTFNKHEDMAAEVTKLNPVRWKVFQCLIVDGENAGDDALRNAERYVIEDDEFKEFIERHSHVKVLVPEYSYMIKNSYLILDEYMRFLAEGVNPSRSLLDVGVAHAMSGANFDEQMFLRRGGKYKWSKGDLRLEW